MPKDTSFLGPVTLVGVNKWLLGCESYFHGHGISGEDWTRAAGDGISSEADDTRDLYDWWLENQDTDYTWDDFKDAVKEAGLGSNWRELALQAFYTTKQEAAGDSGARSYLRDLEERGSVINHASNLEAIPIESIAYKSHMLFNALPDVVSQVMKQGPNLVTLKRLQLEKMIKDESKSYVLQHNDPVPMSSSVAGYRWLAQWGVQAASGTRFTDIDSLPDDPNSLTHMNSITLWGNGKSDRYMIEDYALAYSSGTINGPAKTPRAEYKTYTFSPGEYITGVTIGAKAYQTYHTKSSGSWIREQSEYTSLCYMAITTSSGSDTKLAVGMSGTTTSAFKAPAGWKIVGFRGTWTSYYDYDASDTSQTRYPLIAFGVIMAPVLSDFRIAQDKHLLPPEVSWPAWRIFVEQLDTEHISTHVDPRFRYGELCLSRLNKIYALTQTPLRGYVRYWNQYGTFFHDNFAWLASASLYIVIVLTAMQVGLATESLGGNDAFQAASYGFTVFLFWGLSLPSRLSS
ncbi:ubiquitin-conjugating enzyme [Purpureocillium lavendulum]|uniref:Ubiquitin-conjugating enzyme n=1 Tax=Purpureocillium lavendulum TaxID=1247861 RepID=A0AB34FHK9_9HYPO|nr:ubiquitin-conjugating enzyme [Purpureocillium lavendulum]